MSKKITNVEDETTSPSTNNDRVFTPSEENASKAKTNRIISIVLWAIAIGIEIFAIFKLREVPVNMTIMIVCIVAMLALVVVANILWKKANRLDPASEKNKTKFFIQNQLGLIISVIAFLPLVVLILTNKNLRSLVKATICLRIVAI